jgi:hypothetical protein
MKYSLYHYVDEDNYILRYKEKVVFTKDDLYRMKLFGFSDKLKSIILDYFDNILKFKSFYFLKDLNCGICFESINKLNNYFKFGDNSQSVPQKFINKQIDDFNLSFEGGSGCKDEINYVNDNYFLSY